MTLHFKPQGVNVSVHAPSVGLNIGTPVAVENVPVYEGEYNVTPSANTQVLQTAGKKLEQDITIAPIPSNYCRYSWNGSYISIM